MTSGNVLISFPVSDVVWLNASSYTATSSISIRGQPLDGSTDGVLHGKVRHKIATAVDGQFSSRIQPPTAVLNMHSSGRPLFHFIDEVGAVYPKKDCAAESERRQTTRDLTR
jgi:hypothetical protein